jgi:hypothetical protein
VVGAGELQGEATVAVRAVAMSKEAVEPVLVLVPAMPDDNFNHSPLTRQLSTTASCIFTKLLARTTKVQAKALGRNKMGHDSTRGS